MELDVRRKRQAAIEARQKSATKKEQVKIEIETKTKLKRDIHIQEKQTL